MNHGNINSKSGYVVQSRLYQGYFGRMFRNLPALNSSEADLDHLASRMFETKAEASSNELDNQNIPAGYTYFGQFVDHDITFDPTSRLDRFNDPDRLNNFRSPRFDLDSIYGRGPQDAPYLYDKGFLITTSVGQGGAEADLIRNQNEIAIIGDPRNDENTIISQVQLAFIKFHNKVMEELDTKNFDGNHFQEAKRIVTWHYQWVVIHDFIRRLVGQELLDSKLSKDPCSPCNGLKYFQWKHQIFMPVEFSVAAYRLGHSMIRQEYELNDKLVFNGKVASIPIFVSGSDPNPTDDLRGGKVLPPKWTIQWDKFLDFPSSKEIQFSRKLDVKLSPALKSIPVGGPTSSLPARNLRRGFRMGLPSGQAVARRMGIKPLNNIGGLEGEDPLWFYILKEAERLGDDGTKLGPVGAMIVAEVFAGLLLADPSSFINIEPSWSPMDESVVKIPRIDGNQFELRDIIKFAGLPVSESDLPF